MQNIVFGLVVIRAKTDATSHVAMHDMIPMPLRPHFLTLQGVTFADTADSITGLRKYLGHQDRILRPVFLLTVVGERRDFVCVSATELR
jgi:hypothetical protein